MELALFALIWSGLTAFVSYLLRPRIRIANIHELKEPIRTGLFTSIKPSGWAKKR